MLINQTNLLKDLPFLLWLWILTLILVESIIRTCGRIYFRDTSLSMFRARKKSLVQRYLFQHYDKCVRPINHKLMTYQDHLVVSSPLRNHSSQNLCQLETVTARVSPLRVLWDRWCLRLYKSLSRGVFKRLKEIKPRCQVYYENFKKEKENFIAFKFQRRTK